MKLVLLGCGYTARAIAKSPQFSCADIVGTVRSIEGRPALNTPNAIYRCKENSVRLINFDGHSVDHQLISVLQAATHLVVSVPPVADQPPGQLCSLIAPHLQSLTWAAYLSTVGVYGNAHGEWVDENAPCKPTSVRSISRLAAEQSWQDFAATQALPLAILRLAGIYGPGRNSFKKMINGKARRIIKPEQVFNRIHVDDIARFTALCSSLSVGGVFNICDDLPAPPQDVLEFAAALLNVPPPPAISIDDAKLSPMALSFYQDNKRVSNLKSKSIANFEYAFANYRIGLQNLWDSDTWIDEGQK